jgi:5'-methylthioadenosine phosphorylase
MPLKKTPHPWESLIISVGTVVPIEGPWLSNRAESLMYCSWEGDVINLSTFPEVILVNEAGLFHASVALATDYHCWRSEEKHCRCK